MRAILAVVFAVSAAGAAAAGPIRFGYSVSGGGRYTYPYTVYGDEGSDDHAVVMEITPFAERTFDAPSQDEYYDRYADVIRTGA